ncbi:hypothetical protein SDC9_174172 [bioreactor metagenome]|uniref:Uncharacterized protein n=1 Tax=bioreactor metagenome TaxID=1076179 RepID=A0A645GIP0_9ZZZZ
MIDAVGDCGDVFSRQKTNQVVFGCSRPDIDELIVLKQGGGLVANQVLFVRLDLQSCNNRVLLFLGELYTAAVEQDDFSFFLQLLEVAPHGGK